MTRDYYLAHRDEQLAKQQARRRANPADYKARDARDYRRRKDERREEVLANGRRLSMEYYERHKAKAQERAREYKRRNREKMRDYMRKWRAAHPECNGVYHARRRARRKAVLGSHTMVDVRRIYTAQRGKCASCRRECKLTKDHIVPLDLGGSDYPWNLQGLCMPCNTAKRNRLAVGAQLGIFDLIRMALGTADE